MISVIKPLPLQVVTKMIIETLLNPFYPLIEVDYCLPIEKAKNNHDRP